MAVSEANGTVNPVELNPVRSKSVDDDNPEQVDLEIDKTHTDILQKLHDHESSSNVMRNLRVHCCEKRRLMMYPIKKWEKVYTDTYVSLHIEIVPEAFRMWFYYGFFIYTFLAVFISANWSTELNLEDNVFIDLYGGNNICLFYDFPPFSYVGAVLWFPQLFNILSYEAFDQFRVYEDYLEGKLSKRFIILYFISTIYECLSFIGFLQITATSPVENITVHTIPFFMTIYALWTLSFKRVCHMFNKKSDAFWGANKCYKHLATLYVLIMLACVVAKSAFLWPNFFGAKLFLIEGWEWTPRFMKYTVYLWMFLVLVAPICNYWVIIQKMHTITLVINETPHGRKHLKSPAGRKKNLGLIDTPKAMDSKAGVDV